jgi:hypothetical protein
MKAAAKTACTVLVSLQAFEALISQFPQHQCMAQRLRQTFEALFSQFPQHQCMVQRLRTVLPSFSPFSLTSCDL